MSKSTPPTTHAEPTADYSVGHVAQLLGGKDAFFGMPAKQGLLIADLMRMKAYKKGEIVLAQGAANPGRLLLLVSGEAEISTLMPSGEKLVHIRAVAGELIGEVGFIDTQAHSATCTATTDMYVAILQRDDLIAMLSDNAPLAAQIMAGLLRVLARRVRHNNSQLREYRARNQFLERELAETSQPSAEPT